MEEERGPPTNEPKVRMNDIASELLNTLSISLKGEKVVEELSGILGIDLLKPFTSSQIVPIYLLKAQLNPHITF